MKQFRLLLTIVSVFALALAFIGCEDDEDSSSDSSTTTQSSPSPYPQDVAVTLTVTVKHVDSMDPIEGARLYFYYRRSDEDDWDTTHMKTTGTDGVAASDVMEHTLYESTQKLYM
ncbi:hypothetical protein ACFLQU_02925, partial [Verrucomicrobiota bacterium]